MRQSLERRFIQGSPGLLIMYFRFYRGTAPNSLEAEMLLNRWERSFSVYCPFKAVVIIFCSIRNGVTSIEYVRNI